jgi:hypothetical protein
MGTRQEEVNHLLERVLPWFMVDSTMSAILPMALLLLVVCWKKVCGERWKGLGRRGKGREEREKAEETRSTGAQPPVI